MPKREPFVTYKRTRDIVRHHGWLIACLYWVTEVGSWVSLGHWFRALPRYVPITSALDPDRYKVKAWWQDLVTAIYLMATLIVSNVSWSAPPQLACLASWLAAYVLYDSVIYLVRVLWFDDLKPGIPDPRRGVWSHRRITLLAIIGYVQAIVLFPSIYRLDPRLASLSRAVLSQRAFATATSISTADPLTFLDVLLVALAIFFVVIAIATAASLAYRREEFAPKPRKK